jgi:hypothetical protein
VNNKCVHELCCIPPSFLYVDLSWSFHELFARTCWWMSLKYALDVNLVMLISSCNISENRGDQ